MVDQIVEFFLSTGFAELGWGEALMILVGCVLIYLAVRGGHEPLLLIPIGFGIILADFPLAGLGSYDEGGLLYYLYWPV